MSNPATTPWSDNPNAPKIPYELYLGEKAYFAGFLMGAIFYGIVIVLFFQSMGAFFDPVNRARGGIKWGFVAHATAMFSFATIYTAMSSNIQSISFIDNREFPATVNGVPGPVGYQFFIGSKAIGIATTPMILLNNWLADGLLLYRCHIVYAKSYLAIAVPSLMYLASVAAGLLFTYEVSRPNPVLANAAALIHFGAPYFSIAFALKILLMLMITTRLARHRRNIQNAMGSAAGSGGLYTATITILVESYALNGLVGILYIGTWAANSYVQYIFLQLLVQTEVIAPLLIILRIADRRAVTSDAFTSDSIHFRSRGGLTDGSGTVSGRYPMGSMGAGEVGGDERRIDLYHESRASGSKGSLKT